MRAQSSQEIGNLQPEMQASRTKIQEDGMSHISWFSRDISGNRMRWQILTSFKDLVVFALSIFLAFVLRFDGVVPSYYLNALVVSILVWPGANMLAFTL